MPSYDIGSRFTRDLVRRRTEAAMKGKIVVLRGQLATMDPDTLIVGGLTDVLCVYKGKARIRTVVGAGTLEVSGGTIALRSTIISIPQGSAQPHVDDAVVIGVDDFADADLDTRIFRVTEVDGGQLLSDTTRFNVTGWYESRYWGQQ